MVSLSNRNLGAGNGLVNMSARLCSVETCLMVIFPALTTSLQNFNHISTCFVRDLADLLPIDEIEGRLSPYKIVNFSISGYLSSTKIG